VSTEKTRSRTLPASIPVGVLATVTMDVAMVAASKLDPERFVSEKLAPQIIGRWAVGLCRGRWRHEDIAAEPPVAGEAALGMAAHYGTGLTLTAAYLWSLRLIGARSGVLKATGYGAATSLLPFLVMYPSWGYGAFAWRADDSARMARGMLLGHTAFGLGIGVWAAVLARSTRRTG
jgi:hypothetical protein